MSEMFEVLCIGVQEPMLGMSALAPQVELKLSIAADAVALKRELAAPEGWSLVLCDAASFFALGVNGYLAALGDRLSASLILLQASGSRLSPAEAAARGAADVVTYGDLEHLKAVIARELAAGAARRRLAELSEPSTPAGIAKFIGLGAGLGAGAKAPQAEARPGEEPLSARARAVPTVDGLKIDRRHEPAAALTLAERPGADEGTREAIALDYIRRRIQAGGLALEYQPIAPIEQAHQSPPMYEVLLRLRDERGLLLPARRILPALARGGLLPRVDARVFHVALPILAHVQQRDQLEVRFYVNLAAETLSQPEALQAIIALIATVAIRPGSLVVEVAKSCLASPNLLQPLCDCLLEHGHSLAMKGFEPEDCELLAPRLDWVRQVKINPDVVERMGRASEARKVTAAVRWLQERDVAVIGMAVDHPQLLSRLRELGVDAIQGYFVGMPATALNLPTVEDIGVDPWPLGAP